MSLKTYLPSDIESNIASIRANGSTISANYFTTDLVRPTAISRNLSELEVNGAVELDIPVVPLTLPLYHSSGDNLKSRSFDYDFVLGNTNNTLENHFLIFDAGSATWFVSYLSKDINDDSVSYKLTVNEMSVSAVLDSDVKYKCIDLSKYKRVMVSNLSVEPVEGYAVDYVDLPFTFEVEEVTEETVVQDGLQTVTEYTRILVVTPNRVLREEEEQLLRSVNVITAFTNESYESNLRFVGKLDYEPNLKDYFIYNSTTRYGNLRDFLDTLDVEPHAVFVGKVEDLKGFVFNLETFYNSDVNLLESPQPTSESLGDSSLSVYLRDFTYLAYEELFFKLQDNNTGAVNTLQLQVKDDTGVVSVLERILVSPSNPFEVYSSFLNYGLICLPIIKRFTTEVTTTIEIPGETPEDPPVQQDVTETTEHEVVKGFYIKRFSCTETDDETLQIVFESNEEGFGYTYDSAIIDALGSTLTASNTSLNAVPAETKPDLLSKTFNLAKKDPQLTLSNIAKVYLTDTVSSSFKVADATSLASANYSFNPTIDLTFEETTFFNNGRGVEDTIESIKTSLESFTNVSVMTSRQYAYFYIDTKNSSTKSVLIDTEANLLDTSSVQCLKGDGKLLLNFDTTKEDQATFKAIPELPYIVVDLYYAQELHINPFSYILPEGILKEQDIANINEVIDTDSYVSYEERSQYLKDLSINWSNSILSHFLLPVVPLYDSEDEFSGCVAVYYDPCTIEGRQLETTLVSGEGEYLVTNDSSLDLKYISGYNDGLPVYTTLTTLPANINTVDPSSYFNIKSSVTANLYHTSFEYSLNDDFDINIKVLDKTANIVETVHIVNDATKTLTELLENLNTEYLYFGNSSYPNTFSVSVKASAPDPRYVVSIENISGGSLVSSKLSFETQAGVLNIPLNRSV